MVISVTKAMGEMAPASRIIWLGRSWNVRDWMLPLYKLTVKRVLLISEGNIQLPRTYTRLGLRVRRKEKKKV